MWRTGQRCWHSPTSAWRSSCSASASASASGELASVGRLVLLGAPLQVAISLGLGAGAALFLGSPLLEALFLGAVVSVCSSVVLVKVAGETTLQTTLHGRLALGWSIVQDLLTVVLVVVLSTLAGSGENRVLQAVASTAVALGFVAVVVILGLADPAGDPGPRHAPRVARAVRGGGGGGGARHGHAGQRGGRLGGPRRVRGRTCARGERPGGQCAWRDRAAAGVVRHHLLRLGGDPAPADRDHRRLANGPAAAAPDRAGQGAADRRDRADCRSPAR